MTGKPMLMNTEMASATWNGLKTQTRRIVKNPNSSFVYFEGNRVAKLHMFNELVKDPNLAQYFCPFGGVGDLIWVRENLFNDGDDSWMYENTEFVTEYININDYPEEWRNRNQHRATIPSIHMPKWASRMTLEITDVTVERLQDISEADAIAEGIKKISWSERDYAWKNYRDNDSTFQTPEASFWSLFEAVSGVGVFNINPWLWVIKYKTHKKNILEF